MRLMMFRDGTKPRTGSFIGVSPPELTLENQMPEVVDIALGWTAPALADRGLNTGVTLDDLDQDDVHVAVYTTSPETATNSDWWAVLMRGLGATDGNPLIMLNSTVTNEAVFKLQGSSYVATTAVEGDLTARSGLFAASRSNSTDMTIAYPDGSGGLTSATLANASVTRDTGSTPVTTFAQLDGSTWDRQTDARIAMWSIGKGLTEAELTALHSAIKTLVDTLSAP
jgi:hypothetical protein